MSEKLSFQELAARLERCPAASIPWQHYKTGGTYWIVGCAIAEATLKPLVLYRPVGQSVTFARLLAEWEEEVEHEGRRVKRFTRVEG